MPVVTRSVLKTATPAKVVTKPPRSARVRVIESDSEFDSPTTIITASQNSPLRKLVGTTPVVCLGPIGSVRVAINDNINEDIDVLNTAFIDYDTYDVPDADNVFDTLFAETDAFEYHDMPCDRITDSVVHELDNLMREAMDGHVGYIEIE